MANLPPPPHTLPLCPWFEFSQYFGGRGGGEEASGLNTWMGLGFRASGSASQVQEFTSKAPYSGIEYRPTHPSDSINEHILLLDLTQRGVASGGFPGSPHARFRLSPPDGLSRAPLGQMSPAALVHELLALVRDLLTLVHELLALVRDLLGLVRELWALVGESLALFSGACPRIAGARQRIVGVLPRVGICPRIVGACPRNLGACLRLVVSWRKTANPLAIKYT